jgi:hypothetical protein
VWAKVRGHPWWPAQVFDPADASALALEQRRRRGSALVACFWDKTFAWVADEDALLPFRDGFPYLADVHRRVQFGGTTLSPFASTVDAALGEVARRVEAGLSCDCAISHGVAKKQAIDNAGVRRGAHGAVVDAAFTRDALQGEAFVGYLSALAVAPLSGADRVDLTVATAQLTAFTRWRGARGLPVYTSYYGIDDGAMEATPTPARRASGKRRRPRGGDVGDTWSMSRCCRCGADDALELEDYEPSPQPLSQQMTTKMGKLMSRAAQQMSLSPPVNPRVGRNTPEMNSGFLARCTEAADHHPSAKQHNAGLKVEPLLAGLVLNFACQTAIPPTSDLVKIFSQFGHIVEARAESSSVAVVVFKRSLDAETAFSGTAKIGAALIKNLVSFRISYSLSVTTPIDPPESTLKTQH